jgi:hypothetical protein
MKEKELKIYFNFKVKFRKKIVACLAHPEMACLSPDPKLITAGLAVTTK